MYNKFEQNKAFGIVKKALSYLKPKIFAVYILLSLTFVTVQSVYSAVGIRETINFQGKLVNSAGLNVADGSYSVVFSLYTVSSGGTNIWQETQNVSTVDGLFRVELGSVSSLSSVNFNDDSLYLGIKVGADAEMTPRVRYTATPYAFQAKNVSWSGLQSPNANTSLSMAAYTTSLLYSGTSGSNDLFVLSSSANSTGTGRLMSLRTAADSEISPFHVSAKGIEALFVSNLGRVGIGTTSPVRKFSVQQNSGSNEAAMFQTSDYVHNSSGSSLVIRSSNVTGNSTYEIVSFVSGGSSLGNLALNPTGGNVGIGTTAPLSKLDVVIGEVATDVRSRGILQGFYGNSNFFKGNVMMVAEGTQSSPSTVTTSTTQPFGLPLFYDGSVWRAGAVISAGVNSVIANTNVGSELRFYTGTVTGNAQSGQFTGLIQQMVIDKTGNVGIGTTNPNHKLVVEDNLNGANVFRIRNLNSGSTASSILRIGNNTLENMFDASAWSSGFTETPIRKPNGVSLVANGGGGLTLSASDANGTIRLFTGGENATNQRMTILSNGNVGIGTTSPSYKTEVAGANTGFWNGSTFTSTPMAMAISNTQPGGYDPVLMLQQTDSGGTTKNAGGIGLVGTSNWATGILANQISDMYFFVRNNSGALSERMRITSSGNVGIGTASPNTYGKLAVSVSGTGSKAGIGISNGGYNGTILSPTEIGLLEMFSSVGTFPTGIYGLNTYSNDSASWLAFKVTNGAATTTTAMTIASTGNVGIGTTSPGYKLDVSGDVNITGSYRINGVAQSGSSKWTSGTGDNIYRSTGNVGIGTVSPQRSLDVRGSSNNDFSASIGRDLSIDQWTGLHFGYSESGNNLYRKSAIVFERKDGSARGKIHILNDSAADTGNATLADSKLTIDINGNVGIGTTSPNHSLEIFKNSYPGLRIVSNLDFPYLQFYNGGNTANSRLLEMAADFDGYNFASYNDNGSTKIQSIMLLNSNGNVGIGTTSPVGKLHIGATTGVVSPGSIALSIRDASSPTYGFDFNLEGVLTGDLSLMRTVLGTQSQVMTFQRSSGNVGIGTTNPMSLLDVRNGNISTTGTYSLSAYGVGTPADANNEYAAFTHNGLVGQLFVGKTGTGTYRDLRFLTSNTEQMRITAAGNVGIGTTNPGAKLEVTGSGAGDIAKINHTGWGYGLHINSTNSGWSPSLRIDNSGDDGRVFEISTTGNRLATNPVARIAVAAGAAPAFVIDNSGTGYGMIINGGNVGIGTVSPSTKLHVNGVIKTSAHIETGSGGVYIGSSGQAWVWPRGSTDIALGAGNADRLYITSGGNVGIGTASPSSQLDIFGTTAGLQLSYDANDYGRFTVASDGALTLSGVSGGGALTNIARYSTSQINMDVPTSFNSAGDVSMAYDLYLSNQTASAIKSDGPLTIQSGEAFENLNLTLKASGQGNLIVQSKNIWADGTNVGIGTTSPSAFLNIRANGYQNLIGLGGTTTDNIGYLSFWSNSSPNQQLTIGGLEGIRFLTGAHTSATEMMRLSSNGNVGIGTMSPSGLLELSRAGNYQLRLTNGGTGGGYWNIAQTDNSFSAGGRKLIFLPDSTESQNATVTFTNAGNVGIGTTSPGAKLEVFNNVNESHFMYINNPNTSAQASSSVAFFAGGTIGEVVVTNQNYNYSINYGTEANTLQLINRAAGPLIFKTAGYLANAERMRITSAGNVGIGTTNPTLAKLDVNQVSNISPGSAIKFGAQGFLVSPRTIISHNGYWTGSAWANVSNATSAYLDLTGDITLRTAVATAGAPNWETRLTILNSNGNVGIGTTSPGKTLHVAGSAKIGSGTSDAGGLLTINGGSNNQVNITHGISSGWGLLLGYGDGTITGNYHGNNHAAIVNVQNAPLHFGTNNTAIMTILGNGNVGIGTTNPTSQLTINSSFATISGLTISGENAYDSQIITRRAASKTAFSVLAWESQVYLSAGIYYDNGVWVHHNSNNNNQLFTLAPGNGARWHASNNALSSWDQANDVTLWDDQGDWNSLVQSTRTGNSYFTGGNVGIGTTNPGAKLDVRGQVAGQSWLNIWNTSSVGTLSGGDERAAVTWGGSDHPAAWYLGAVTNTTRANTALGFYKWTGNGTGWNMVLNEGNVGIGTVSPSQALHVTGRIRMDTWTADGDAVAYRDNATNSIALLASDIRLKKDIIPIRSGLEVINQIGAYMYHELDENITDKYRLGVMAQELMPLMPELVYSFSRTGTSETFYSVHYDKLAVLLLKGIQEQQLQIEAQSSALQALDPKILDLENTLAQIELERATAVSQEEGGTAFENLYSIVEDTVSRVVSLENSVAEILSRIDSLVAPQISASDSARIEDLSQRMSFVEAMFMGELATGLNSTASAQLAMSISENEIIFDRKVVAEGDLSVLGETNLGDVGVTGNITNNMLVINGFDESLATPGASLNTLAGALNIQSSGLNSINFIDGSFKMDTDGNFIIHKGNLEVSMGSVKGNDGIRGINVSVGQSQVEMRVNFKAKNDTENYAVGISPSWFTNFLVSGKDENGFTVKFSTPAPQGAKFDWIVIE